MYYLVKKAGSYLSDHSEYSSVWYNSEDKALKIWDFEKAFKIADNCEGELLERSGYLN